MSSPSTSVRLVSVYGADLRQLITLDSRLEPMPKRRAPTGSLQQRIRAVAKEIASDSGDGKAVVQPKKSIAKPATDHTPKPNTYYPRILGYRLAPHTAFLDLASQELSSEVKTRLDDMLARELWTRYDGWLLPPPLARSIATAAVEGDCSLFLRVIDEFRRTLLDRATPLDVVRDLRIKKRIAALRLGAGDALTEDQTAVAELFCDACLLQRASLEDLARAEVERESGETRGMRLLKYEDENTSAFDATLPHAVRPGEIEDAIPPHDRPLLEAFARRRSTGIPRKLLTARAEPEASAPQPQSDRSESDVQPRSEIEQPEPPRPLDLPPLRPEPLPWAGDEPAFVVPEWASIGRARVSPAEMSRHWLVVGGTGAGKTTSVVLPLARAALCYPGPNGNPDLQPAILALDPKLEIGPALEDENTRSGLGRRIIRLEQQRMFVSIFEGEDPLNLSAQDVVERVLGLASSYLAEKRDTRQPFFIQAAQRLLENLVAVDLALYAAGGNPLVQRIQDELARHAGPAGRESKRGSDPCGYWRNLLQWIQQCANRRSLFERYREIAARYGVEEKTLAPIATWVALGEETWSSVIATLENGVRDIVSSSSGAIWLNPLEQPPTAQRLSILEALDNGWCITYSPATETSLGSFAARGLKSVYFRLCFLRRNKNRPVVIVADEYQNYHS